MVKGVVAIGIFIAAGICSAAAEAPDVENVLVVGTAPADVQTVLPDMASASHIWTAGDILNATIPSAFLSDTESNPLQQDLYFRGFDASPVLGTAEGLAVYQDGTRINQRFGDTVLWDMLPASAIDRIDVVPGSDPVFGLNALGGAIVIRGDEANLQAPLPGYVVLDADAEYQITKSLVPYIEGENILDRRYATFGLYGDPTGNGAFPSSPTRASSCPPNRSELGRACARSSDAQRVFGGHP